ncbi:hypothetical protein GCM10010331_25800 [Streptomyces xanthochromogenes]|nr:hypothetical protein GCM10010331_25800 [Streptomyces xanthochromogenes]
MTAVVLVHGLYHRPEHFAPVTERLRAAGVDVVVPELHRGSLTADTLAVQAATQLEEHPVHLCGLRAGQGHRPGAAAQYGRTLFRCA